MSKKRFLRMIFLGIRQIRDTYYQGFAAQVSFYFMCALVPTIILISQVLVGLFHITLEDACGWLFSVNIVKDSPMITQLRGILTGSATGLTNIILIFIVLWASSGAEFSLMRISNYMYTEGRTTGRGYFKDRFRAIFIMVIFIVTLIMALLAVLYGGKLFTEYWDMPVAAWKICRWPVALLLYTLLISFQYYIMPTERLAFRRTLPGGLFAAGGMLIVTMFYTLFFGLRKGMSIYGVLSNIVAIMLWFFLLAWVLILGMLFNKVWMDTEHTNDPGEDDYYYID